MPLLLQQSSFFVSAPVRRSLCVVVSALLVCPPGFSQQPALAPSKEAAAPLEIFPLQGEAAVNVIPSRTSVVPVVEIRDELSRPISGAEVTFKLPETGAGGYFTGRQTSFRTLSNAQGQAAPAGYSINSEQGRFPIHVSAALGDRKGALVMHQTNALVDPADLPVKPKRSRTKWYLIAGLAAAGVTAGVLAATRNGSSSSVPTITLSPGAAGVGGPR